MAVITFRQSAEVRDRVIRLADVAVVEGGDAALVAALEAVEVGTSPLSGRSRSVSAEYAKVRIRQIGVNPNRLLFGGGPLVTVSRPDQVVPGVALVAAAQAAVAASHPEATAQVTFTPADLHLPTGNLELRPQAVRLAGASSGTVAIQVLVGGRQEALPTVSFRLSRHAPVVVALRDLGAGTVLTAADVGVEQRPVSPGPPILGDASLAVGRQAAQPIRTGMAVAPGMLKPAMLVKRGSRVKVVCKGPRFTATVAGEALQDGAAGQPVRVRNQGSLLEITGIVVGPQTVEVPF
jgi:flagella basal body P-ring formation protein FlgA